MLQIQKTKEPKNFTDWKRKFKNRIQRQPNYDDLSNDHAMKNAVKMALLREQHFLCCYCCAQISEENSHIEHFRPQSKPEYSGLSVDYQNLHASCTETKHCGYKKDDKFDEDKMISPLTEESERSFIFSSEGKIEPVDDEDEKANYTRDILNLNEIRLVRARESALWESGAMTETGEKLEQLVELYSKPNEKGQLIPFCDAVLWKLKDGVMTMRKNKVLTILEEHFWDELEEYIEDAVSRSDWSDLDMVFDVEVDYAQLDTIEEITISNLETEEEDEYSEISGWLEATVTLDGYTYLDGENIPTGSALHTMGFTFSFCADDDGYSNFDMCYEY